jgi:protease-4
MLASLTKRDHHLYRSFVTVDKAIIGESMGDIVARSESSGRFGIIGTIFGGIWSAVKGFKSFVGTLLFFFLLIIVVMAILSPDDGPKVPKTAALVVAPSGVLVEQLSEVDPFTQIMNEAAGGSAPEVAAKDIIEAIDRAAEDDRIKVLVLYLDRMGVSNISLSKTIDIGAAIDRFSATQKKVIAVGDFYSQPNYLIASHADEIWMHPFGGVDISGYGALSPFFKSLLDNLKIKVHSFSVGEFKSAFEPFTRDDMSESSKKANLDFLGDNWSVYTSHVEAQRGLEAGTIDAQANQIADLLRVANGNSAQMNLDSGLVDALLERDERRAKLIEMVGQDEEHHSFNQIEHASYLKATGPGAVDGKNGNIAVIVATGTIINGDAPVGTIGGDSVARLIYKARNDENTKAIVLRVDSGGGSAFASEIIRRELVVAQEAGIPVIASMSSVAASGGYWISMSADEIWAAPTTLTGSIGVAGIIPTFEDTADWAGVHIDGVGTTDIAATGSVLQPLSPILADVIQQSVQEVYDMFINKVAISRDLPLEHVAEIAEGRVWSGTDALDNGLVDKLGGLDDAVASAAAMAGLEEYDVVYIEKDLEPFQQFLKDLTESAQVTLGLKTETDVPAPQSVQLMRQIMKDLEPLTTLNDPNHVYLICEAC